VLAAAFGLPFLLVEGFDVDPCFNKPEWDAFLGNIPGGLPGQAEGLQQDIITRNSAGRALGDMCGWRRVAKAGFTAGSAANITALLAVSIGAWV
jgi:hypothetical protein